MSIRSGSRGDRHGVHPPEIKAVQLVLEILSGLRIAEAWRRIDEELQRFQVLVIFTLELPGPSSGDTDFLPPSGVVAFRRFHAFRGDLPLPFQVASINRPGYSHALRFGLIIAGEQSL